MKIGAFPAASAFLPALAKAWLAAPGEAGEGMILLPSRRAARALAGAFLRANGGRALLLPRIVALGGLDETALSLGAGLNLPPAIPLMRRQAILARLILQRNGANGAPQTLHAAWALARDLALLLDEADDYGVDLAATLPGLVAGDFAAHWQTILQFLQIVTEAWPEILSAERLQNPAARQAALLAAQAQAWRDHPPGTKIWLVARDARPAEMRLARVVATLPAGLVLLPGYDGQMPQAAWAALDDGHAQAGIARLLGMLGARRDEILQLDAAATAPAGRVALLSRALLPAASLHEWQAPVPLDTAGLFRLEARDEQEDATAIAMILRAALEVPGRSAALITPDRGLAARVAAALLRFGITADDSAGEALADTPPAVLLRLLARAAAADWAPLPLLALLKHPLCAAGLPPETCRDLARRLEVLALRGPRPAAGFDGIKFRLDGQKAQAEKDYLARLERILLPVTGVGAMINPAEALRRLVEAGEALAATDEQAGAALLWGGEAGAKLAEVLLQAMAEAVTLPDIPAAAAAEWLDALLAEQVVRRPRTRDGHPRIAIWGVQEAFLQNVDVAVLGGLNEGVWPGAAGPGPWLSRPMRKAAGLPAAERDISLAAHDFFSLAAGCPLVVLAAPSRRDRAPAVPARWITRLEAMLAGAGGVLPRHDAAGWAAALDVPASRAARPKPRPRPPAGLRPRELSVSDIATLMADPYAIYARRILRIKPLDALDEESDASQFGNIVHAGLAVFFSLERDFSAAGAADDLTRALHVAMRAARPRACLQHWWEARLGRIARWVVAAEQARRQVRRPVALALEAPGVMPVAGGFRLRGRADRVETYDDGSVMILDYKTGRVPTADELQAGSQPQLPLEAMMAEAGAFGGAFTGGVTELAYWKLSGQHDPGAARPALKTPQDLRDVIARAAASLPVLLAKFSDEATPYLAQPHPGRSAYGDVYGGISRFSEWRGEWRGARDSGAEA